MGPGGTRPLERRSVIADCFLIQDVFSVPSLRVTIGESNYWEPVCRSINPIATVEYLESPTEWALIFKTVFRNPTFADTCERVQQMNLTLQRRGNRRRR